MLSFFDRIMNRGISEALLKSLDDDFNKTSNESFCAEYTLNGKENNENVYGYLKINREGQIVGKIEDKNLYGELTFNSNRTGMKLIIVKDANNLFYNSYFLENVIPHKSILGRYVKANRQEKKSIELNTGESVKVFNIVSIIGEDSDLEFSIEAFK